MIDQIMDSNRNWVESTLLVQQDSLKPWTGACPVIPTADPMKTPFLEEPETLLKRWAQSVTDRLTRHRERLDEPCQEGIMTIDEALRLGEANAPRWMSKLVEEIRMQNFECLKTESESNLSEVQTAAKKWIVAAN